MSPAAKKRARLERSRREATFNRCPCGNVAGVGETHCGACRPAVEQANERAAQFATIRANLSSGLYLAALDDIVDILEELAS